MGIRPVVTRRTVLVGLAIASVALSSSAGASTLRCERGIVARGDTIHDVLARCGEPQLRDSYTKSLRTTNHIGIEIVRDVTVERWTYERGRGKFIQILVFESGRLTDIERGPRR